MGIEKDVVGYKGKVTLTNVRQHSVMHVVVRTIGQEYLSSHVITVYIQIVLRGHLCLKW